MCSNFNMSTQEAEDALAVAISEAAKRAADREAFPMLLDCAINNVSAKYRQVYDKNVETRIVSWVNSNICEPKHWQPIALKDLYYT